jgi:hypothetical protein
VVNILVSFAGYLARDFFSQTVCQKRAVLGQLVHNAFVFGVKFQPPTQTQTFTFTTTVVTETTTTDVLSRLTDKFKKLSLKN